MTYQDLTETLQTHQARISAARQAPGAVEDENERKALQELVDIEFERLGSLLNWRR